MVIGPTIREHGMRKVQIENMDERLKSITYTMCPFCYQAVGFQSYILNRYRRCLKCKKKMISPVALVENANTRFQWHFDKEDQ
jgi:hypothetical protein